jgi:hypothetical protein
MSQAPNYGEARGAESRANFVHKLPPSGPSFQQLTATHIMFQPQIWYDFAHQSQGSKGALCAQPCSDGARRHSRGRVQESGKKRQARTHSCCFDRASVTGADTFI